MPPHCSRKDTAQAQRTVSLLAPCGMLRRPPQRNKLIKYNMLKQTHIAGIIIPLFP
jgi:hypothetical protein